MIEERQVTSMFDIFSEWDSHVHKIEMHEMYPVYI